MRVRQRLTLTAVQIGAILGLESLIQACGLTLVCPRCLDDGESWLDTDNTPDAPEFKIDCGCRERRIASTAVGAAMAADGDLAAQADAILNSVALSLRCPERRCIRHPLEIERTPTQTIIRCRCAKTTLRLIPTAIH